MNIEIEFTPHHSHITHDIPQELVYTLYDFLTFRPKGYFFSPKYQCGQWDGFNRLFNTNSFSFPSGLLQHVKLYLESLGYTVIVTGFPTPKDFSTSSAFKENLLSRNIIPRDYQIMCCRAVCEKRFGVVRSPARSGKTLIAAMVIDSERLSTSFFCRSIDLARQAKGVFESLLEGVTVGLIGDGECTIGDVNVITIQSAYNAFNKKFEIDKKHKEEKPITQKSAVRDAVINSKIVFYDEYHHASSKTSAFILGKCINTTMMIGLSATPFSGEAEDIVVESICGPVLFDISYSELIQKGYILRPYISMYKLPKMPLEGNYPQIYKQAVVDNDFLNNLLKTIVSDFTKAGKSVVVQTEYKNHSKKIGKLLHAPVLIGDDDSEIREREKQRLMSKENLCLVSTLYEEGIDVPGLDVTINLAGNISEITTLQRMRSMTVAEGKEYCEVVDFIHQCKYLSRHSKARLHSYESEPEFVVNIIDVSKQVIV